MRQFPGVATAARERASELVPGTNALLGEALLLCHDRPTGLSAAIAVDDTTLGPGLGGVRWMPYTSFGAAVEEACRLSQVMTLKNALADIPYGGAKSVIMRREGDGDDPARREAQLRAFATLRQPARRLPTFPGSTWEPRWPTSPSSPPWLRG